jgi:hypothetical protein
VDLKGDNIEIYVNFENALGHTYCTQCVDKPNVTGTSDTDDGTQLLEFSWVITNEVTASKGTVKFSVCVKVLNSSNEITNEWYTVPFEGKILRGINVTDETTEVVVYPTSSMALLMSKVAEFEASLDDYAGYTKDETNAKFEALDLKYALQTTVNAIIAPNTAGNAGQILRSKGSSNKPEWVTLSDSMININSSIGSGVYTGTSNLTNHLIAIYNKLGTIPTGITTENIKHDDGSADGIWLDTFLMGLQNQVNNSVSDVALSGNTLTFTRNNGSNIPISIPTNTKEWKPVTMKKYDDSSDMTIDEVVSSVANTSFLASSMGGSGYFIFKFEDETLHQYKYYMGYVNLDNSDKLYNGYSYLKGLVANIVQNPGTEGSTINRYEEYLRIKFTDYNTSGINNSIDLTFCVVIDNKIYENHHSYYDGMPEFLLLTFKGAWRLDI